MAGASLPTDKGEEQGADKVPGGEIIPFSVLGGAQGPSMSWDLTAKAKFCVPRGH